MRYSKLGRGRKKKQKWRKPKGRDNKMREMRRGYPAIVNIGRKTTKIERGNERQVNVVYNIKDLQRAKEAKQSVIFGKIGKKKKIAMAQFAKQNSIIVANVNIDKLFERKT
jgi:large subunit ribosomal protein L32e